MSGFIKLSSPATGEFWEIPILFEDEHLLALSKPARLLVSPDSNESERPNLINLLHHDIERSAPWVRQRGLTYLMNAHRLDFETSGVILLAKSKPVFITLADQFGADKPIKIYVALVRGSTEQEAFHTSSKLAPHPTQPGLIRVDPNNGKSARTDFKVRERFASYTLVECRPLTDRTHQIRVHLQNIGLRIVGDTTYGGPPLLLSALKRGEYRLKPGHIERPLISGVALHAEKLILSHPITEKEISIEAPWPRDLQVAVKYLRRYATL